jgi:AraC family transcriptional regulator of adaptative response/methylated-DNA-[protein]-cysteine methyltransferase
MKSIKQVGADDCAAIGFAVAECSLGVLLVARSARGVCAILLGDAADQLERDLQRRFPADRLIRGGRELGPVLRQVIELVESRTSRAGVPLDIRGTTFERRVWSALRRIPAGSTASYAQIAARIGAPQAARAVARACAANKLAVAVPCHRVVRSDGALSGYRWGVARKRALLAREAAA